MSQRGRLTMRCSEPGPRVPVAIPASRGPGRCAWVVRRFYASRVKIPFIIAVIAVAIVTFVALRRVGTNRPNMNPSALPTPAPPKDPQIAEAHRHSIRHRDEVLRSEQCGCFYCLAVFLPSSIVEWCDTVSGVGQTALCPHCGIDSVIGSAAGFPLTQDFLTRMKQYWF